ncbi:hypothetical protein ABW20_dc0109373 [Dactylellina cionopaga]|nr:hypothetical protein ABW20_dc0109373 [Dactylellina cionopaga]
MLDERHHDLPTPPNDNNSYTLGSIGKHNVVIACLPKGKSGTISAATVAMGMLNTFSNIKFGLMVGIGSGIPKNKVRLGDVVVSTPIGNFPGVVQWDQGSTEDGKFKRTGALNNPPKSLLTALAKLETEQELSGSKIPQYLDELMANYPRLASKYARTESLKDILFKSNYNHVVEAPADDNDVNDSNDEEDEDEEEGEESCKLCDQTKIVKRKPRGMQIHYGLIASGNQTIKDGLLRDNLNKDLGGNLLCVEMEAAGLLNDFPCITIRGISDYADSHKDSYIGWQEHAAATAAAFAKELLGCVKASDVEAERPAKELVQIGETVSRIDVNVEKAVKILVKDEELGILNWLTKVDYGALQNDYIKRRQPGSGQWLLDSIEFDAWIKNKNKTIHCPGIPGAGKTIMAAIVINHLQTIFRDDTTVGIAYIYFNFNRRDEQTTEDVLANILRQLAQSQPCMPDSLKNLHQHHKVKNTRPSLDEVSRTLDSVAAYYSRVFIIIDAIDESQVSEGSRGAILSEVSKFRTKVGANYLATSRFIPGIMSHFEGGTRIEVRASEKDVQRYLEDNLPRIEGIIKNNQELQNEVKDAIIKSVDGM